MINFVEYNGEGSAKERINKFECHFEVKVQALGDRTKESLLQYALSGDAFEWYSDHIEGRELCWAKFLVRFGLYRSQASDVVIVAQGSMNVREYYAIFSRKAVALGSLTVSSMISCFIRGLNPNLRNFMMSSRPSTFDTAVALAYEYEAYLLKSNVNHVVPPLGTPLSMNPSTREEDRPGRGPNRTLVCYNCQGTGHLSRDCPQRRSAGVRMVQYENGKWEVFTTRRSAPDLKVEKPDAKRHDEHVITSHFKKLVEEHSETEAPIAVDQQPARTQFEPVLNAVSEPEAVLKPVEIELKPPIGNEESKKIRKLGEIVEKYNVV